METKKNISLAHNYWGMMKHLKRDVKIDLIVMLTESLKAETDMPVVSAHDFYGIWGDDGMDTDEFVRELKGARRFKKDAIEL